MLRRGSSGERVRELQQALLEGGFNPGATDGNFGLATEATLRAFQRREGLEDDGVAGPLTWSALTLFAEAPEDILHAVTVPMATQLFPRAAHANIKRHLPLLLEELRAAGLTSRRMVLMALATIRAETEGFAPVSEAPSRFNTTPGGVPFDRYDHRRDLGNRGPTDGADYRGRGFVQLTGRHNYGQMSHALGLGDQLLRQPDLANEPRMAARILAAFLRERQTQILSALADGDLRAARRLVNGGHHGLERFSACYRLGKRLIP